MGFEDIPQATLADSNYEGPLSKEEYESRLNAAKHQLESARKNSGDPAAAQEANNVRKHAQFLKIQLEALGTDDEELDRIIAESSKA